MGEIVNENYYRVKADVMEIVRREIGSHRGRPGSRETFTQEKVDGHFLYRGDKFRERFDPALNARLFERRTCIPLVSLRE